MSHILLVEPYHSGSHRAWANGLVEASKHEYTLLTLPGRFWKWRMFGGTLTLGMNAKELPKPDVVIASDMVNLPAFIGHSGLTDVPAVLFMHENQLTYPLSPTAKEDLAYAYMNWASMVRADEVWWNSQFHFDAVIDALPSFLRHFPDARHTSLLDSVIAKSRVMHVGVDLSWVEQKEKTDPPVVVWNQRWEYDKDPGRLFDALYRLAEKGNEFQLAICGENFRNVPEEFNAAKERLAEQIIHFGFAQTHRYEEILLESSVVLSTAKHEFFGVAAVEAMAAGAVPVFPNALSYPELIPDKVHDDVLYDSETDLDELLGRSLGDDKLRKKLRKVIAPAMKKYSWDVVGKKYDDRLKALS